MKAPDKIYVASYNGEAFSRSWTMEPLGDTTATEYIRKDALLEWLNERYKSTISNVGCYTGHSVWAEVIEHINEM